MSASQTSASVVPVSAQGKAKSASQKRLSNLITYAIVPIALLLIWYAATDLTGSVPSALLPAPTRVGKTFVELLQNGELLRNTLASLERIFYANVVALAAAIPIGLMMGLYPPIEKLLDAVLTVLRPIPPLAWVPLSILWFGIGATSVVFITFIAAFFAVLINTIAGARSIDQIHIRAAQTFGASRRRLLRKVILPSVLPYIFTGFRIGIGASWMSIVAAELVAATSGLGYMIAFYRELLRTDAIIVGMLTIGAIGFLMEFLSRRLENHLLPWRRKGR
ncbi:ABC transporter permease [Variovorax boronicumulans]